LFVGQTRHVTFDPYAPYGPLVDTTLRVVVWNVWGRYGAWEQRQAGLEDVLAAVEPDIACLVESWATPQASQADRVGDRLGLEHRVFVGDWDQGGWTSGIGVVSRWPITQRERQALRGDDGDGNGEALLTVIDGPRGPVTCSSSRSTTRSTPAAYVRPRSGSSPPSSHGPATAAILSSYAATSTPARIPTNYGC
jgi:hypothetical protein